MQFVLLYLQNPDCFAETKFWLNTNRALDKCMMNNLPDINSIFKFCLIEVEEICQLYKNISIESHFKLLYAELKLLKN